MVKQVNQEFDHKFGDRLHKIDGDEILERFCLQARCGDINPQHNWFKINDKKWHIGQESWRVNKYERDQHEKRWK